MTTWHVYILECGDGSYYTGIALDVKARFEQHSSGKGARYTRGRGPLTLRGKTRCANQGDALRVEHALKQLSRLEKHRILQKPHRLRAFARKHLRVSTEEPKRKR